MTRGAGLSGDPTHSIARRSIGGVRGHRALRLVAMLALACGACYQPRVEACQLACSEGARCPDGYSCRGDGFCHASDETTPCGGDGGADASVGGLTAISAGNRHACAIRDGALYCWGDNRRGQLGLDPLAIRRAPSPQRIGSDTDWIAVAAGFRHTCGVHASGAVACWGNGDFHENGGAATDYLPQPVQRIGGALGGATAVCAGGAHACALADGELYCWGNDAFGQLGDGVANQGPTPAAVTVLRPAGVGRWQAVACASSHTCALGDDHQVYCWGDARSGRLGFASAAAVTAPSTPALADAVEVAVGDTFGCARRASGPVACWGSYGAVTDTAPTDLGPPAPTTGATAISAGGQALCVTTGATTRCLGYGGHGDLGNGSTTGSGVLAQPVLFLDDVTALTTGTDFHCAIAAGILRCWGKNSDGQVGIGATSNAATPRQVPGQYTAVSAGRYATCAVGADMQVRCWGDNHARHLIVTEAAPLIATPTVVPGITDAVAVATGSDHQCALRSGGTVTCWGSALYGRVGDDTTAEALRAPTTVISATSYQATAVTVADHVSGAVSDVGPLVWGDNSGGRLGLGNAVTYAAHATSLDGVSWQGLALGQGFGCGLRSGQPLCWGTGDQGRLGLGDTTAHAVPTAHSASRTYTAIATAPFGFHACAIGAGADAGKLYCWGANDTHQVADSAGPVLTPTVVGTATGWTELALGPGATCGILGGTLTCWGNNADDEHQLGIDSDLGVVPTPTVVGSGFHRPTLGFSHGCALRDADQLWCWGDGRYGALGRTDESDQLVPRAVGLP